MAKFELHDAGADVYITDIVEGQVLYLDRLPFELTIVAVTAPEQVGSVMFQWGQSYYMRLENQVPYSLASNVGNGDLLEFGPLWTLGPKTVTATPYSERDARGIQYGSRTVNFQVFLSPFLVPPWFVPEVPPPTEAPSLSAPPTPCCVDLYVNYYVYMSESLLKLPLHTELTH